MRKRNHASGWLFAAPHLILFVAFTLGPLLVMTTPSETQNEAGAGLKTSVRTAAVSSRTPSRSSKLRIA